MLGESGVWNCYVFKSRLLEYAQKVGLRSPVYETVKEGPSCEPYFRSSVAVNGVAYNSLAGFYNRRAAEQSAAEVALFSLAKSGHLDQTISLPLVSFSIINSIAFAYFVWGLLEIPLEPSYR